MDEMDQNRSTDSRQAGGEEDIEERHTPSTYRET
jgi:hypothetical protein